MTKITNLEADLAVEVVQGASESSEAWRREVTHHHSSAESTTKCLTYNYVNMVDGVPEVQYNFK